MQYILRADGFGNVPKGADGSSSDRLSVGFQQLEKLEADTHPLFRRYEFGTSVSNTPHLRMKNERTTKDTLVIWMWKIRNCKIGWML
jgi:hypothetical protein